MQEVLTKEYLTSYLDKLSYYKFLCKKARRGKRIEEAKEFKKYILKTQSIIKQSISNINKEDYKKILTMRYVYSFKWRRIITLLFQDEPDFEDQKDYKYRDKAFYWYKQALKALRRTNKEEDTAIKVLGQIKQLCRKFADRGSQENEFVKQAYCLICNL